MKLNKDNLLKWHTIFNNNQGSFITNVYNKSLKKHPLIILYNEYDQTVFYLKGQTFKNQWFYNEKEPFFYRIEPNEKSRYFKPKPNANKTYVFNDTLFDTSTIYEMKLEKFIEYYDLNEEYSYLIVESEHQRNILKNLHLNFENGDIAHKIVNVTLKNVGGEQEIISKSYYSYVSRTYLIRNFGYGGQDVSSFDLESLIKKFKLDIRKQPLSYNTIGEIISNAIYDFEINYPEFINNIPENVPLTPEPDKSRSR